MNGRTVFQKKLSGFFHAADIDIRGKCNSGFLTEYRREMLRVDKKVGSDGFKTKLWLIKVQTDIFLNLGYKS